MLVTLVLTSIIMLAIINLLAVILRVSANTHNRARIREDLVNFVLEFEKDLRNASRVGICEGENDTFQCDIFTNAAYRWQSCERSEPDFCIQDPGGCDTKNVEITMCKYLLDDSEDITGDPVSVFNPEYNMEHFGVTTVADEAFEADGEVSARRVISFYAVVSHPNKRLEINNIIRQSIVSTKNFENSIYNN